MSRFRSYKHAQLKPYVPGEQPRGREFVKLNTNENPYPPSEKAIAAISTEVLENLRLYSDPQTAALNAAISSVLGVNPEQIVTGNGSDVILSMCFQAFCDDRTGVCFPDVTYGFYSVLADLYKIDAKKIPLRDDFTVDVSDYAACGRTVVLANPNAPTGIALPLSEIRKLLETNRDQIVIIDEAYIDFGGESALPLLKEYDNLVVVRTFSKGYNLA